MLEAEEAPTPEAVEGPALIEVTKVSIIFNFLTGDTASRWISLGGPVILILASYLPGTMPLRMTQMWGWCPSN